ncbi:MAG: hypothetical protein ABIS20_00785 [Thermoanaerobaculia bacterium]
MNMKKKLLLLALAMTAVASISVPKPAAARPPSGGCGWVCSAPGCCNYCCIDTPCAYPICDL